MHEKPCLIPISAKGFMRSLCVVRRSLYTAIKSTKTNNSFLIIPALDRNVANVANVTKMSIFRRQLENIT